MQLLCSSRTIEFSLVEDTEPCLKPEIDSSSWPAHYSHDSFGQFSISSSSRRLSDPFGMPGRGWHSEKLFRTQATLGCSKLEFAGGRPTVLV